MTSQPGESPSHRIDGPCGDDVRMVLPRPGDDRRASLRPRPADGRTTRREERGPVAACPIPRSRPMPDPKALSPARTHRNRTP